MLYGVLFKEDNVQIEYYNTESSDTCAKTWDQENRFRWYEIVLNHHIPIEQSSMIQWFRVWVFRAQIPTPFLDVHYCNIWNVRSNTNAPILENLEV